VPAYFFDSSALVRGCSNQNRSVYDYGTEAIILICKEPFPEQKYVLPMSAEEKRAAFPVRLIDVPERLQPIS